MPFVAEDDHLPLNYRPPYRQPTIGDLLWGIACTVLFAFGLYCYYVQMTDMRAPLVNGVPATMIKHR